MLAFETRVRIELLMPRIFVYILIDVTLEILTQFLTMKRATVIARKVVTVNPEIDALRAPSEV
jgi:hypothetical protein